MTALDARRRIWLARSTRFCGATAAALAAAALLGWTLSWPALEALFIGPSPVHGLLAAGMILVGASLARCVPQASRACKSMASLPLAIAGYTLAEYAVGRAAPIDGWLPQDLTLANPRLPGHMTLLSAVALALVAGAVLSLDASWRGRRPSNLLAGSAWTLSLLGLVNHLYTVNVLTGGLDMALPSAVIFLLLSSGILTARPGLVTRLMLDPGPGGEVARRFFPASVIVPITLGWLRILGERFFPTPHAATAVLAISIAAVFNVLIVRLARRVEEAAQEHRHAEKRFRDLLESAPDGMVIVDPLGKIVIVNNQAERLFGYSRDELLGRPVEQLMPQRFREKHPGYRGTYARDPKRRPMGIGLDLWGLRKDGSEFPVEISLSPIATESGAWTISAIRDITDRKSAERTLNETMEKLKRSNQELESFAYVASHDLQEPLRKVTSFAQLFARRYADKIDAEGARYVAYVVDGAQRMQRLIADLLAYSRLGSAGSAAPSDLAATARAAWNDLAVAARESGARLELGELPTVNADPQRLLQLFENLLGNAVKFRKEGEPPVVRVWAEKEDGRRVVAVADNGIGIEKRYHDQIFSMFRRLHAQDEYPGTGIGLAICKRVVEQLGGKIWVESEPGKGSTFRFTIPESALR